MPSFTWIVVGVIAAAIGAAKIASLLVGAPLLFWTFVFIAGVVIGSCAITAVRWSAQREI